MKRSMATRVPDLQHQPHGAGIRREMLLPRRRSATNGSRRTTWPRPIDLAQWRRKLTKDWGQVRVEQVDAKTADTMQVGAQLEVQARVNLGTFISRRRGRATLPRPGRQPGRHPQPRDRADEPQRRARPATPGSSTARSHARPAASTATRCACCRATATWPIRTSRAWSAGGDAEMKIAKPRMQISK